MYDCQENDDHKDKGSHSGADKVQKDAEVDTN